MFNEAERSVWIFWLGSIKIGLAKIRFKVIGTPSGRHGQQSFPLGPKGQLISKCPFGFIVWTKLPTKLFLNFCLEIFCFFLGASWKLFGASCRLPWLWYYILSPQEAQRASMKPQGSYKKNLGQKSRNNFAGIFVQTMKPKGHFEINWPLETVENLIYKDFFLIGIFFHFGPKP